MAKPARPRTVRTTDEISEMLFDQIEHLRSTCLRFDEGDTREYRRIATCVRVLFHNTSQSHSLITQAGLSDRFYVNSAQQLDSSNKISECNLVGLAIKQYHHTAYWKAVLDNAPLDFISLQDWWTRAILSDQVHPPLSRADVIGFVANQDGGAHVDPAIDEAFHKIRRDGFQWSNGKNVALNVDRHIVRQIGHEVIKSLDPEYSKESQKQDVLGFVPGMVFKEAGKSDPLPIVSYTQTIADNACPCLSGLKYKECHKGGAIEPTLRKTISKTVKAPPNAAFAQMVIRTVPSF